MGRCHARQNWRPLLFAVMFNDRLDDRKAAFKRLNGNNPATSCTNLVSLSPVTLQFTMLKRAIFAMNRLKSANSLLCGRLAFQNYCSIAIPISAD